MMTKNNIYFLLMILLVLPIISAETTFFEGELGYRDDFIMVNEEIPEVIGPYCGDDLCNGDETCSSCPEDCGSCGGGGSSGILVKEFEEERIQICDICFKDLREHLKEKQIVEYAQEDIVRLNSKINDYLKETKSSLNVKVSSGITGNAVLERIETFEQGNMTLGQTRELLENFEVECDSYMPMLGGLIPGRYRSFAVPILIAASVLVIGFAVYLFYVLKRVKKRVRKKVRKKETKKARVSLIHSPPKKYYF
ncbi:hypothetical protein HNV12_02060 [Methanococcoides sp. SA1]|nr:hypothetical protein [Methanococcoides sp. SA1]